MLNDHKSRFIIVKFVEKAIGILTILPFSGNITVGVNIKY